MTSRAEILHDHLVQLFEAITKANGYRTDVQRVEKYELDPQKLTKSPCICILFGDEVNAPKAARSDNWAQDNIVFGTMIPVYVWGLARKVDTDTQDPYDAGAALLHDIKRVAVDLFGRNVIDATNKWVVNPDSMRFTHPIVREHDHHHMIIVAARFNVQMGNLTKAW